MTGELDPARPADLERLLQRHGARARKRLGQNFLVDADLRDRIAAALGAQPGDDVLEVGAGAGTLTVALARSGARVVAVELDRRLVHALRTVTRAYPNVEVVEADVLKLDLRALFPRGGELVAGNIPYYLTGALVRRLLEPEPRPRRLALLVQREVAERWSAGRGASLATVAVQVFAEPRLELVVPPEAFAPRRGWSRPSSCSRSGRSRRSRCQTWRRSSVSSSRCSSSAASRSAR